MFGNDPDVLLNWWLGDSTWTRQRTFWYGTDGYNKLHELMEKATATSSTDQRQSYWNQAMDVVADEVPIYGLFHRNISTAVRQVLLQGQPHRYHGSVPAQQQNRLMHRSRARLGRYRAQGAHQFSYEK